MSEAREETVKPEDLTAAALVDMIPTVEEPLEVAAAGLQMFGPAATVWETA